MLELPFFDLAGGAPNGIAMIDYLAERMPQLLADARRLVEAGWDVAMTGTGMRFRPSAEKIPDGDPADTLPPLLDALGVQSDHRLLVPRPIVEIEAEMEWCRDLARYWDAKLTSRQPTHEDWAGTWWEQGEEPGWREPPDFDPEGDRLFVMEAFEARYGRRELPANDWYDLRRLRDRLVALQWVLGRVESSE